MFHKFDHERSTKPPWQYYFVAAFLLFFVLLSGCSQKTEDLKTASGTPIQSLKTPEPEKSVLLEKKKIEKNAKLQSETDSLLALFDKMPQVPTYIVDEPIINDGDETERASAYTLCENKDQPTILVKRVFYEKNKPKHVAEILRHELIHAWFCRQGIRAGHDERFQEKLKSIESSFKKNK